MQNEGRNASKQSKCIRKTMFDDFQGKSSSDGIVLGCHARQRGEYNSRLDIR